MDRINQSIDLLMQGEVDYEFRTTFTPRLKEEDIFKIAVRIKGAKVYALQQFRNIKEDGEICYEFDKEKPYSSKYIKKVTDRIKGLTCCVMRGEYSLKFIYERIELICLTKFIIYWSNMI